MAYILSGEEHSDVCIFCSFPSKGPAHYREHQILCSTPHAFAIMNKYPYSNGHVMVVPRKHTANPEELTEEEYAGTGRLLQKSIAAVKSALGTHGLNIGMNLGRVAGAGIDKHCHWHIVPRWNGDTNFMPVIGDVKVMSEHLDATYERLLPFFATLGEGPK